MKNLLETFRDMKPDEMRDAAWRTIHQYVFAPACGVREFYGGGWMKEPGKVIACCNDGLRPVIMKLEATDEESKIDYEPVIR